MQVDATHDRVDVRVLEAGDQQPTRQVDDLAWPCRPASRSSSSGPTAAMRPPRTATPAVDGFVGRGREDPSVHEERVSRAAHIVSPPTPAPGVGGQ